MSSALDVFEVDGISWPEIPSLFTEFSELSGPKLAVQETLYLGLRTSVLRRPPATALIFARDTFRDVAETNLTAHDPQIGGPWISGGFLGSWLVIDSLNKVRRLRVSGGHGSSTVRPTGAPGGSTGASTGLFDFSIECDLTFLDAAHEIDGQEDSIGLAWLIQTSLDGTENHVIYSRDNSQWELWKKEYSGGSALLDSFSASVSDNTKYHLRVHAFSAGTLASNLFEVYLDGVLIMSADGAGILSGGQLNVGIYTGFAGDDNTAWLLDNFVAYDTAVDTLEECRANLFQAWDARFEGADKDFRDHLNTLYSLGRPFYIRYNDLMSREAGLLTRFPGRNDVFFTGTYPIRPPNWEVGDSQTWGANIYVDGEAISSTDFRIYSEIGVIVFSEDVDESAVLTMDYEWVAKVILDRDLGIDPLSCDFYNLTCRFIQIEDIDFHTSFEVTT